MSYYVVDIEADGQIPGPYSMVCIGAVRLSRGLTDTFYGQTAPLPGAKWDPEALAISGFTHEEHLKFPDPAVTMKAFGEWVKATSKGHPIFISDNPAFDFAFANWYFWTFCGGNPFGFSARRIGDLYAGLMKDSRAKWKHLRKTPHDHNPVNDAKGNAEALIHMVDVMGLKLQVDP
jgi:hypothetical protein